MLFIKLFLSFIKIGFTSFGGISMIPLITDEMLSNGWMTTEEINDIVAIAEMTPGPLGLNCATYAGLKTAGFAGAVVANLGALMPAFTLCVAAAIFFEKFKKSHRMQQILSGVRPAAIGMVAGVIVSLSLSNYFADSGLDLKGVVIGAAMLPLLLKFKVSVPKVIGLSAALGLLLYGIL